MSGLPRVAARRLQHPVLGFGGDSWTRRAQVRVRLCCCDIAESTSGQSPGSAQALLSSESKCQHHIPIGVLEGEIICLTLTVGGREEARACQARTGRRWKRQAELQVSIPRATQARGLQVL